MAPTRDALLEDFAALHAAGGLGYWVIYDTPLPAIEQLAAVQRELNGTRRREDVARVIRAVLERAIKELELPAERAAALELFGISDEARRLRVRKSRIMRAAEAWGPVHESTYRRKYLRGTFGFVADRLLDDEDAPRQAGRNDDGRPPELDERSTLDEIVEGLQLLPKIDVYALASLTLGRLDVDLRKRLAGAYHSLRFVHEHQTFLSYDSELELRERAYDHDNEDWLYVLARRDLGKDGFVQQEGWDDHVGWLREHVRPISPPPLLVGRLCTNTSGTGDEDGVKQVRVVIARSYDAAVQAAGELCSIHRSGTLFYFPQRLLSGFEPLKDLRYGMTVSRSHRYAMVTVPPTVTPPSIWVREPSAFVRNCLERASSYDRAAGDMRAIVSASDVYVEQLRAAFEQLIASQYARSIPCGAELRAA